MWIFHKDNKFLSIKVLTMNFNKRIHIAIMRTVQKTKWEAILSASKVADLYLAIYKLDY